jgi:hypothetical protein
VLDNDAVLDNSYLGAIGGFSNNHDSVNALAPGLEF